MMLTLRAIVRLVCKGQERHYAQQQAFQILTLAPQSARRGRCNRGLDWLALSVGPCLRLGLRTSRDDGATQRQLLTRSAEGRN